MSQDANPAAVINPGSTIGILGGGQLGRMMAIAAKQMGYRVHIFSSIPDSPAGQVADREIVGCVDDLQAVEAFSKEVDVVTIETENIPTTSLAAAANHAPAFPGEQTLAVSQDRGLEKQFLADHDIPTAQFRIVKSLDELREAAQTIMPGVLKTCTGGYDGKGQYILKTIADVEAAWQALNTSEAILEEWIEYEFEFSVVGARNATGASTVYPSIRNEHRNNILDVSISPSGLPDKVNANAIRLTQQIMQALNAVGVLTVEFFYRDGEVLVNEMAPRPHNSGHLTIEGHQTSQFEQHIRAVCGLTFGSSEQICPVAMANLLGDQWSSGEPKWHQSLSQPNTKLHLYGKDTPEPKRKMGHMTTIANDPIEARNQVLAARELLTSKSKTECLTGNV